jgi:isohexenylglutaconyl-CoA hydratase
VSTLSIERIGPVLHVTLNRPAARNAMSLAMVGELRDTLARAEADGALRVLVLRGAGGHFCAGADLKDLSAARDRSVDAVADVSARFGRLCAAFAHTYLATVAVLEGAVMGGGFALACVCDVAIANDSAVFRLPETSLGLVPAQVVPWLAQRIGVAQARRLALTGVRVSAHEALALGLAHEVHAADALDGALARVIDELLQCAPGAVSATKALLAKARGAAPEALIDEAAELFARAALGPEGIEGATAFLAKRPPSWSPLKPEGGD